MTGYEGGAAVIKCSYPKQYGSNQKYLFKKSRECSNTELKSEYVNVTDERFSLYDNPLDGNVMVLITHLTNEDRGLYRCVVDNAPRLISTDLQLKIKAG